MKKIILIALAFLTITASGVTYYIKHKSNVPVVSENANIPLFVDTFMLSVKNRTMELSIDSVSNSARLMKLGFTSKAQRTLDCNTAFALSVLQNVYDTIYPNHKFITYGCLSRLMKKYELSFGDVSEYIGEIPVDRIDSMEKFIPSYILDRSVFNLGINHDLSIGIDEIVNSSGEFGNIGEYINRTYNRITNGQGFLGTECDLVKYAKLDLIKRPIKKTSFFIVAPSDRFEGSPNYNGTFGKIKDPIVLAPVAGGFIIVTAW